MNNPELTAVSPAKQAQDEALEHAGALKGLVAEFPAGSRTPEDEATLGEWHQEGKGLRNRAEDLDAGHRHLVHFDSSTGMPTTPEGHRELVAAGEIKPTSGTSR